jgi:hypothetical protein
MEKKIEAVTKEGRIIRVMPHMIDDLMRYDVSLKRPAIRDAPKELLNIPQKTILPKMIITEDVKQRKQPVRSRSKK